MMRQLKRLEQQDAVQARARQQLKEGLPHAGAKKEPSKEGLASEDAPPPAEAEAVVEGGKKRGRKDGEETEEDEEEKEDAKGGRREKEEEKEEEVRLGNAFRRVCRMDFIALCLVADRGGKEKQTMCIISGGEVCVRLGFCRIERCAEPHGPRKLHQNGHSQHCQEYDV